MRLRPRHPWLGRATYRLALPVVEGICARKRIFRSNSGFALERFRTLRAKLAGGEPLYLGGICASGTHNAGERAL
jgi:carbamoyltransferase